MERLCLQRPQKGGRLPAGTEEWPWSLVQALALLPPGSVTSGKPLPLLQKVAEGGEGRLLCCVGDSAVSGTMSAQMAVSTFCCDHDHLIFWLGQIQDKRCCVVGVGRCQ